MMLRIEIARYGAVSVLRLIGRVESTHVDELRAAIRGDHRTVMLDLDEVSLVDLDAVRFLVACEAEGIELIHCSRYIREWMKREPHNKWWGLEMPMIDVYATAGTFADTRRLATELAGALMTIERVPDIPLFRQNTAAFVHELSPLTFSNVDGEHDHVRVQVLTNAGALDRDKQLAVVSELTRIIAAAAKDSTLSERTWVLLTEAPDGGWGLAGHAHTNAELVAAARAQLTTHSGD
jgi:phenylpyruvate tautomerase PptA (4-oxalocrotonate tautomerase family)